MHNANRMTIIGLFLCCVSIGASQEAPSTTAKEDSAADDAAIKASAILRHDVGVWDCEWRYLDSDGNVVQTVTGTETMTYSLGDKLVEITTAVPAENVVSKSLRFYNPVTRQITVLSVGADGNHWELNQDIDSDDMISKPHPTPDGGSEYIRFRMVSKSEDAMEVTMEMSPDATNWQKIFEQSMKRRTE